MIPRSASFGLSIRAVEEEFCRVTTTSNCDWAAAPTRRPASCVGRSPREVCEVCEHTMYLCVLVAEGVRGRM